MTANDAASVLHLDSSPAGPDSVTRQLGAHFLAALRRRGPVEVVHRDLDREPPPLVDTAWLAGAPDGLAASETLIGELEATDHYVFALPMHNFTVPANFKAWIDQIIRPGRTFRIGADGSEGLLRGKTALFITARGGYYQEGPTPEFDQQEPYLRKAFQFIGVDDVTFVHAEGTAMGDAARRGALDKAEARLDDIAATWLRAKQRA